MKEAQVMLHPGVFYERKPPQQIGKSLLSLGLKFEFKSLTNPAQVASSMAQQSSADEEFLTGIGIGKLRFVL